MWAGGAAAGGAVGQLWSCAEVGGPMPTVSATAPATATRRPPSPILTHRLRWRIAAHLVGDEVFTFGRPRCLYCKRGQLQGRKVLGSDMDNLKNELDNQKLVWLSCPQS